MLLIRFRSVGYPEMFFFLLFVDGKKMRLDAASKMWLWFPIFLFPTLFVFSFPLRGVWRVFFFPCKSQSHSFHCKTTMFTALEGGARCVSVSCSILSKWISGSVVCVSLLWHFPPQNGRKVFCDWSRIRIWLDVARSSFGAGLGWGTKGLRVFGFCGHLRTSHTNLEIFWGVSWPPDL